MVAVPYRAGATISFDAATGHYYQPVSAPAGITWTAAEAAAVAQGGYLASIQNAAENNFVFALISSPTYWTGFSINNDILGPWIGGFSSTPGTWTWASGDTFSYTNWYPTQPDGYGGTPTQAIDYYDSTIIGSTWGDASPGGNLGYPLPHGYVIEFNTNPSLAVPDSASTLALLGLASLALWQMRRRIAALA